MSKKAWSLDEDLDGEPFIITEGHEDRIHLLELEIAALKSDKEMAKTYIQEVINIAKGLKSGVVLTQRLEQALYYLDR